MRTVKLERTIRAPLADVFEWLTDATNFQRVPVIRRVTPVRPGDLVEHGVGAVRLLVTPLARLIEEIVEYEPPRLIRYKLLSSCPPMRVQDGCLEFKETAAGTWIRWTAHFEVAAPLFADVWTAGMAPMVLGGIRSVLVTAEKELRRH